MPPRNLLLLLPLLAAACTRTGSPSSIDITTQTNELLGWLPEATETLIVGTGPFRIPSSPREDTDFEATARLVPLGLLLGVADGAVHAEIVGQPVVLAAEASCCARSPTGLGMQPFDGCQIIVFEPGTEEVLDGALRLAHERADGREDVADQRVARFDERWEEDDWTLWVARPKPNVLVCATERGFLRETLEHIQGPPRATRALPESLREWQHVDRSARLWAIRHYRADTAADDPSSPLRGPAVANVGDADAVGLTFEFDAARGLVRIRYLTGSADALRIANEAWRHPDLELAPRVTELEPGVVEILQEQAAGERSWGMFLLVLLSQLGHTVYL